MRMPNTDVKPVAYTLCPKCKHTPLPIDQSLPTACPACGLILAKYATNMPRNNKASFETTGEAAQENQGRWRQWRRDFVDAARHVPERVDPAMFWPRVALLVFFAAWGLRLIWMDFRTGEMGGSFLHGPLLVFHEAGHVIFSLFGHFVTILGGTLGQLLMPTILCGAMLMTNRDPFGAAIGLWLFGASVLDVAPYVYDALQPQLVLLGGHTGEEGGHDWIYLLSETGLLKRAQSLGWLTHKLGALVILVSLYWATWILRQQHAHLGTTLDET